MDTSRDTGAPLVTRKKTYATEEVWDCHRSIIAKLYQDEKMSLKQVKQIMERDYSLYATERMFKTRLRSWGLEKKLKESEA
ncbi:Clr5 domain-containing protein, partial [Colletotrichum phormii]